MTYNESQPLPEELKKSIASSMWHVRETVRRHASCAPPTTQEEPPEGAARGSHMPLAVPKLTQEPPEGTTRNQQSLNSLMTQLEPPEVGEAVAVVEKDSTVARPCIWVGRCLCVDGDQVIITPFKEISRDVFQAGGKRERAHLRDVVSPIDLTHSAIDNTYRLGFNSWGTRKH